MTLNRRAFSKSPLALGLTLTGTGTGLLGAASAHAQGTPVRMVVPWPAGGSTDAVARLLAEALRSELGAPIVIDNKGGAGGRIGLEAVKNAAPDGSVFAINPASGFVIYPHVYKKLSYDPFADFVPVVRVCRFPYAIAVGPGVPSSVGTVSQLLRWCAENQANANYGVSALGSGTHFAGVKLARDAGVALRAVPYRGDAPLMQDLMAGVVPMAIVVLATALPLMDSGRLRVLATSGGARSALTPQVPTVKEGLTNYEMEEWFGTYLPRGAAPEVVNKLDNAIRAALRTEPMQKGLAKLGFEAAGESQGDFARLMRNDLNRWGPIVVASGFTAEE
jgi:tripartite-type tricarboxylate transporter receptor subunit TctC